MNYISRNGKVYRVPDQTPIVARPKVITTPVVAPAPAPVARPVVRRTAAAHVETEDEKMLRYTRESIIANRTPPYKGINVVISGFNDGFEATFPGKSARQELEKMIARGQIASRPGKIAPSIYLPEDAPDKREDKTARAKRFNSFWKG